VVLLDKQCIRLFVMRTNPAATFDSSLIFFSFVDLSGSASRQTKYFFGFPNALHASFLSAGPSLRSLVLVLSSCKRRCDSAPPPVAPLSLARIITYYAGLAQQLRAPPFRAARRFRQLKGSIVGCRFIAVDSMLEKPAVPA
jgi:hypothetical protein